MPCLQIHDTWGCGLCEKQIWSFFIQSVHTLLISAASTLLGIYQKVQRVCLWASHASASLCTATTLTPYVAPLAWETHSLKKDAKRQLPEIRRDCCQAGCLHHTHQPCKDPAAPTCSRSDETRSRPAINKKPFIFSELGHRKWTFVWRAVTETCGKCAFPHEQQEENGIKLDQGRFILVKESRIRDWSIGSNTLSHLLADCSGPSAKFPFFFDPLFILPQWNRFPRIHQSLPHCFLSLVLPPSLFFPNTIKSEKEGRGKQRWCQTDKSNKKIASFQPRLSSKPQLLNLRFEPSFYCERCSEKLQQHNLPSTERKKVFLCHHRYAAASHHIIGKNRNNNEIIHK